MSHLCDCNSYIPPENIGDMRFLCDNEMPGVVILQGRIVSNGHRNTSELISDVEKIAIAKSDVIVQGVQLRALDNCSVYLEEIGDEPDCVKGTSRPQHLSNGQSAGIGIGAIAAAAIVITLIIVIIVCIVRRR